MADIDMIPRSYRDALRVRRILRTYGSALALAIVAGGAGAAWVQWRLAKEGAQLDALRSASASAEALRGQVAAAQQRRDALRSATEALAALRGRGELARLTAAIDGTINERVWFSQLEFSRTHELLRAPLPNPLPTGTLQLPGAGAPEYWRLASHVEIAGQASDHAALTQFLGAMNSHPALADVRFLNSASASGEGAGAMSFSVAGALRTNGGMQ